MTALALDLASKRFGATEVLGPIALRVDAGETLALTGPSGIGKSTLLRILAGLDRDFHGTLRRPKRVAMAFQEPTLLPWRSARDNITLVTGADDAAALRLLSEVGLEGRDDAFPGQLSLGQQRRLALARALAAAPDLLLLDEPFASLDADLAAEMLELTRRLLGGRRIATVFVTHSPREAARLASRVLRMGCRPARIVDEPSAQGGGPRGPQR